MKHFVIIWIFALAIVQTYATEQKVSPGPRVSAVTDKLNNLINTYNNSVYTSLFSIDELKPSAILQVDRLASEYSNNWTAPEDLAGSLSTDEKASLIRGMSEVLATDYKNTDRLVTRIRNWCIAELQFTFLQNKLEFTRKSLLNAISRIPEARNVIAKYLRDIAPDEGTPDEVISDMHYYNTLNALSAVSFKSQLAFYSKIYGQLSVISEG